MVVIEIDQFEAKSIRISMRKRICGRTKTLVLYHFENPRLRCTITHSWEVVTLTVEALCVPLKSDRCLRYCFLVSHLLDMNLLPFFAYHSPTCKLLYDRL